MSRFFSSLVKSLAKILSWAVSLDVRRLQLPFDDCFRRFDAWAKSLREAIDQIAIIRGRFVGFSSRAFAAEPLKEPVESTYAKPA